MEFCPKSMAGRSDSSFLDRSYSHCTLCPRSCGIDRTAGRSGYCGMSSELHVARIGLHMWEEPCLSGSTGSGTVFFTGCSLGCLFCQNRRISRRDHLPGKVMSCEELASSMLDLQKQGANNINFVTGSHYVPHIIESVRLARKMGLTVPTVYNCGGYESLESIRMLSGTIDIYLPDLKFFSPDLSYRYAGVRDYFERATAAIDEMVRQQPKQVYSGSGIMSRGVIVRHLMLPGQLFDSKHILDHLCGTYGNTITISLMNQYTPMPDAPKELSMPLSGKHYDSMVNYLSILGQTNAWTQEGGTVSESFVPDFE